MTRLKLRGDNGTLTLFTAITVIGLLVALGFIVDAGQKLQAGQQARAIAEEAARAGAGQVNRSAAYAHGGTFTVDPAAAAAAARTYLAQTGHAGAVTVTGDRTIQVTVTITEPAVFTAIIGISQVSATQTATANLVQGITGAPAMSTQRSSGAARAATGLASLLALAVLIAGLPAALYAVGGSPIPHAIPSWHQVTTTLGRPDHGTLLLAAIRCVSWLAWAAFTTSALVEVFSQVRGRTARRLPVISPVQGFAAALVGTAILGLLPGPHLPRPAPPLPRPAQAVATAPPHPSQPAWASPTAAGDPLRMSARPGSTASPPATPHREVYTVVEGDNLWDIAARRLSDGERWHEIYALNRGRHQPGGGSLTDPSLIYPGWILLLPAPAGGPSAHAGAPSHQPSQAPPGQLPGQQPGADSRRHPGPVSHHPARPHHQQRAPHPVRSPASVTPGRERPVGIHLPTGGLVGITLAAAISAALVAWRLHRRRTAAPRWPVHTERSEPPLPEAITKLRRAHLRSVAADDAEALGEPWPGEEDPGAAGPDGHGGAADDGDGLDEFGAPTGPAAWRPTDPETTGPATTALHPTGPGPVSSSEWAPGNFAVGPMPAPVPPAAPAHGLGGVSPAGSPAGPGSPVADWRPAPPPGPPLPAGTVAFGMRDGAEIPLPAVTRRGLGLTGPGAPDAARALLIGLLAVPGPAPKQASAQVVIPEADARQLTGDHQHAQIPGVVPGLPDGLIIASGLGGALDHIETEITHRLRLLGETGDDDFSAPRTAGIGEAPLPPLALIASVDQASTRRVEAVLEAGERTGLVVIVLGDWAAGTTCRISADGTVLAATDPAVAGAEAFHLPAPDAATMLGLLRGAQGHVTSDAPGTPGTVAGPEPGAVTVPAKPPRGHTHDALGGGHGSPQTAGKPPAAQPPPGQDHPVSPGPMPKVVPPAGGSPAAPGGGEPRAGRSPVSTLSTGIEAISSRPVQIAVLGPLQITALGSEIRGGLRKARELLAYLALHPDGVTGEAISEALWPESGPRYATAQRNLALRKAREMLRTATGLSQLMFIILASERYRLDPALIDVDLWRFEAALDQARTTDGETAQLAVLQLAAALYHGPLVDGAAYDWAERYAEPARRRAVDALARIAEILQPTDPEQSLTTLEAALAHDPYNEAVYHKIMHLQAGLGRPDAARRTLRLLETRLAELGLSPDPATRQAATGATGNQAGHPLSPRRS